MVTAIRFCNEPGRRKPLARWVAVAADLLQIVVFPAFFPGVLSPLNGALDVLVGFAMVLMLGWHIAFLPTFVAELIPFVDLFPTWTLAVLYVTRKRGP
jgi:hypothetical protein